MMKLWKIALLASASLTSNLALAEDEMNNTQSGGMSFEDLPLEISIMGGVANLNGGNIYIPVTAYETDELVQTNENHWSAGTGRAGIGYNAVLEHDMASGDVRWFPVITPQLNVYYTSGDLDGDVYRFESPAWNQETYEMEMKSTRLSVDVDLTLMSYQNFSVYGIGGVGVAWTQLDFLATANSGLDCPIVPMSLETENSTSFAWEAGAGINARLFEHVSLSLEYLYSQIQNVNVGLAVPYVSGAETASMDVSTQAVMLGLRFDI